jgi:hypothetical protein
LMKERYPSRGYIWDLRCLMSRFQATMKSRLTSVEKMKKIMMSKLTMKIGRLLILVSVPRYHIYITI